MIKFINAEYKNLHIENDIILFGATSIWDYYLSTLEGLFEKIISRSLFIVDNDSRKWGTSCVVCGKELIIKRPSEIENYSDISIIISVELIYHRDICSQLLAMTIKNDVNCYSLPLMNQRNSSNNNSCIDVYFKDREERKIEPTINCLWFGNEDKPELYKKCIDSWRKYCPNYEVKEWTSKNYDLTKNRYLFEAYEAKKWAFVSDYARLDIIYNNGGLYFDMDVELTANIDQLLLSDCFMFRQTDGLIEPGSGFGAVKGHKLIGQMLHSYDDRRLIMDDGKMDMTSLPQWLSPVFKENGIRKSHDSQIVGDAIILSDDYIRCCSGEKEEKAIYGIHWHNASWLDDNARNKLIANREVKNQVESIFSN